MPTTTYFPLASITLSGAANSVTFSSISQAYNDIYLTTVIGISADTNFLSGRINGDSTSGLYRWGNSTETGWNAQTSWTKMGQLDTEAFATGNFIFTQYTMTDRYRQYWGKIGVTRKDNLAVEMVAGSWDSGNAMTSLTLFPSGGTFTTGSSFAIYGVIR